MKKIDFVFVILTIGPVPTATAEENIDNMVNEIKRYSSEFQTYTCSGDHKNKFSGSGAEALAQALTNSNFSDAVCKNVSESCLKGALSLPNSLEGLKNCVKDAEPGNTDPYIYTMCCETAGQVIYYMNQYLKIRET